MIRRWEKSSPGERFLLGPYFDFAAAGFVGGRLGRGELTRSAGLDEVFRLNVRRVDDSLRAESESATLVAVGVPTN
jgi:hypothetical protein